MHSSKVSVGGISQPVLPELRRPLEELVTQNHSLKVSCQVPSGSQEIFLVVAQEYVDEVRAYVQSLSKKYF